jgi:hypothetical protein
MEANRPNETPQESEHLDENGAVPDFYAARTRELEYASSPVPVRDELRWIVWLVLGTMAVVGGLFGPCLWIFLWILLPACCTAVLTRRQFATAVVLNQLVWAGPLVIVLMVDLIGGSPSGGVVGNGGGGGGGVGPIAALLVCCTVMVPFIALLFSLIALIKPGGVSEERWVDLYGR